MKTHLYQDAATLTLNSERDCDLASPVEPASRPIDPLAGRTSLCGAGREDGVAAEKGRTGTGAGRNATGFGIDVSPAPGRTGTA